MLDWLRRLGRSKHTETGKHGAARPAKDETVHDSAPETDPYSRSGSIPSEESEPVLVRGRFWKNTSEARWDIPREQDALSDASLEGLIKRLARTDRTELRRSAAEGLGQMGQAAAPAIPALINAAVDVDATVREAALAALMAIDPAWPQHAEAQKAFPGLIAALASWSLDVTNAAINLLDSIGPPAVPDMAHALLHGEDTVEMVHVMRVLARMGPNAASAVPGLTRALGSQFLQARIAAAEALARIGPAAETAVPALVAGLADPFADGRQAMAACLARVGAAAEPAVPALLPLLSDREVRVREAAAEVLEQIGSKVLPALIEILQTRDVQRLKAWLETLIEVPHWYTRRGPDLVVTISPQTRKSLVWLVYDIREEQASLEAAQKSALRILGKFGPEASAAVPMVAQALADPNPAIRLAAVQALGQIGLLEMSALPSLIQMLADSKASFREAAAEALGNMDRDWPPDPAVTDAIAALARQLGKSGELAADALTTLGPAAVPALIDALETGNRVTRQKAAKTLGQIGPGAKAAIPALTEALQDSHRWVQDEAAKALERINAQAA